MNYLTTLEQKSIFIIREAYANYRNMALLWSIGKDSTTLLWLCRKAFFGNIPFSIIHLDTSFKFPEIYKFREKYAKEWGLNLIVSKNKQALKEGVCASRDRLECCNKLKTQALKNIMDKHKFEALLVGIRRDEHGIRAKERVFSPRDDNFRWDYKNQPPELWDLYKGSRDIASQSHSGREHIRIHPLLHWREIDIWEYVKSENIPLTDLYFSKNGKRYRSIGCTPCCEPIKSKAKNLDEIIKELNYNDTSERAGRTQDKEKENTMQQLRSLGYM